jgi:N-methylhydantoinase A
MYGMSVPMIGIDIGGTFTDVCLWDGAALWSAKAPTTPEDLVRGVNAALDQLGVRSEALETNRRDAGATSAHRRDAGATPVLGCTAGDGAAGPGTGGVTGPDAGAGLRPDAGAGAGSDKGLTAEPDTGGAAGWAAASFDVVQGSTVATNALLERKGVRAAFIATAGFADILRIGRQNRPRLYDLHVRKARPVIDPEDCFEVPERLDAGGGVLRPLDEQAVREVIAAIRARGIEDVAVCLLFSFLSPAHEQAVGRLAEEAGLNVSLSCEVLPEFREFERASTTAINAHVAPLVRGYLGRLEEALGRRGARQVRVMQSNGGQIGADVAGRHAVRTILSGPAGGVVAALAAGREAGCDRLITYDMGGTSTDVSLCLGSPAWTTEAVIDGWPVRVPMLDIHTIGAGGGSIAAIDAGGALMVGPGSAGADPGPACYGKAEHVTVTDANVVLGRVRPEFFLGGRMKIDPARSAAAMDRLAGQMGVDRIAAAVGVVRVANANMERAIKAVTAERGHDPRGLMLLSFGGAGGLHACELAAALRLRGVIIPVEAGVLSAQGMLEADILRDYTRSIPQSGQIDLDLLRRCFGEMMDAAAHDVQLDGYEQDDSLVERFADMRYRGQSHEITVPVESLTEINRLVAPFHAAHQQRFGYACPGDPVEVVTLRSRCVVTTAKPRRPHLPPGDGRPERALLDRRPVHFAAEGPVETCFYERSRLLAADELSGPAVVLESFATSLVPPGWRCRVHAAGHLEMDWA